MSLNGKGHCHRRLQTSRREHKHSVATEGDFLESQLTHQLEQSLTEHAEEPTGLLAGLRRAII